MPRIIYNLEVTITLEDGGIFYSNNSSYENADPSLIPVEIGLGQIFPIVEASLPDMQLGEYQTFNLPPEDAFGAYDEQNTQMVPLDSLPVPAREIGKEVMVTLSDDAPKEVPATVSAIHEATAEIDFNHALAGLSVRVDVTLVSIDEKQFDA